jgi:hypothetical protein
MFKFKIAVAVQVNNIYNDRPLGSKHFDVKLLQIKFCLQFVFINYTKQNGIANFKCLL